MLFFQDGQTSALTLSFAPIESIELINWPVRADKMQYKSSRKPQDITVCSLEDPGIVFTSSSTRASNDEIVPFIHLKPLQPAEHFRTYDRNFVSPNFSLFYGHCNTTVVIYCNLTCVSLSILLQQRSQ